MSKIFGIDLGTNSIGWALRNPDLTGNQIEKFGVLTFNKGIGIGKTGEYSYAAERTKKRSTRRLYQARKYRLWATLEHLIAEGYCPLSMKDLNIWRRYNKEEAHKNNNAGRVYPIGNIAFDAWIKLDFDNDGKPDYASPYQLRKELAEDKLDFSQEINRFKLGRAFYHIAQRRGFKSSRKGADDTKDKETNDNEVMDLQYSEKKKNKIIAELFEKYTEAKTIGWLFALLENDNIRIRESITQYAIRENYKDEIKFIFQFQGLGLKHPVYVSTCISFKDNKNKNCIGGTIFYKRPLRSQKGLVGKCTLEPNKYRVPINHPAFETFRAWSFLNNVKYKENNDWKQFPLDLKQEIFSELFFRKSKSYFPFSEIITFLKKKGKNWELNYKPKTTVTGCPVSARLKDIFGDHYLNVKIIKTKAPKSDKAFYDIEDIWHILFNYEDQECVAEFAEQKLKLEPEKVKQFIIAWNALPVGYGMLSLNAITKINVFLQKGLIYTEAVLLANIPEVIGKDLWLQNEKLLLDNIGNVIAENRLQKSILNIVNNLISKHKNLEANEKFGYKDNSYKLVKSDLEAIQTAIEEQFSTNRWDDFSDETKREVFDTVKDCYQAYFSRNGIIRDNGNQERIVIVQSNGKNYYKTESGYYRSPKLINTLVEFLLLNFEVDDKQLQKIYHPSEINIYPPAKPDKDGTLKLGSPKTGSFKNPMAMRTMHELRNLMNYMIETDQIDNETRIVVEVARDLNDSNKRWAIEAWQRQRESENQEFEEAIKQLLNADKNVKANAESGDDIDKIRLFYEQNMEQTLPSFVEAEEEVKGKKKNSVEKDEAVRWGGHGKKLIDKYRLWREQGYQCLYTGKLIKLNDLFNENVIDFEHTVPRSKSFDNSLANLTVCYHDYNRTIKKNQIPTKLPNYDKEYDFGGSLGKCGPIKQRLITWEDKVERIKQQIDFWKTKSKKASDKQWKDDAIRQRHLWQMELDYWQNKLDRFTITEITSGFKNSQKVDTQLISKYAFHYLKTYFDKVDVQKGSITAEFRKIYQLQIVDEKKDRSKHSHHAKDAAVLTLIPVAAKRDSILEKYYEAKENKTAFNAEPPFAGFKREFVWSIDDSILINNITNNQELTPAKRKVRKRGKEVFIENPDGTKAQKWATGDSIRGQLHQETFYGAIKPAKKGENGNLLKDENGKFVQEEKIKYVLRVPFNADFANVDKIVDEGLRKQIKEYVQRVGSFKKAFEEGIYLLDKYGKPHGNKIRHIRVWASVSEPLAIKKQSNLSDKEYKQSYWAANATNSFFAIYSKEGKKAFAFRNLYDTAKVLSANKIKKPLELFEPSKVITKSKLSVEYPLSFVLEPGLKVIFKKESNEEIKVLSQNEILKRLYVYTSFEKNGPSARLNFNYHLEARSKIEESYVESEINFENPKPTLRFGYAKYDFLVEGYDFEIKMDGTIEWLKQTL
ncbi:type II CRISPR RNA-guided endonuclease Cas9 [Daejeonella sp. H1SJ63]|uniref:type II CRISPR RNA-guided endonuclease Cas9 n=1 Tax=Daejeonella sp. H1SJ63 TaxID=3034145 RepID=UPI0023EBE40D|nr:type II CRISPR RNA-guided endonuclease Cas9 [Daejeonella sp. H1SJ63]